MPRLLRFPDPVNEVSARLVAAGVVVMAALTLGLRQPWLLVPIAYGFVARVATGPTLSRLAIAPRPVPGPPKRFAQGIGAVVTVTAALLALVAGLTAPAYGLVAMLLLFASLESFAGFCVGCTVFAALMRAGVIPASVCQRCLDIGRSGQRLPARG
jgi:hypothetical protein